MKKLLTTISLAALMMVGFAGSAMAAETGTINKIVVGTNGGFYFYLNGLPVLCATAPNNQAAAMDPSWATAEGIKNMLSILLAAKLSGKSVVIHTYNADGSEWACRLNAVELLD